MAYPGEYRREQYYGDDGGYGDGGARGNYPPGGAGYGGGGPYAGEGYGAGGPYGGEGYGERKHEHHHRSEYQQEGVYGQPGMESDLGTGLRGGPEGYGVGGYGRGYGGGYGGGNQQAGFAPPAAYGQGGGYDNAQTERLEEELKKERRRAREAEAAAAAAAAYALYERHESKEEAQELERFEPAPEHKHKHHFFSLD